MNNPTLTKENIIAALPPYPSKEFLAGYTSDEQVLTAAGYHACIEAILNL